ncbi:hypothetical protein DSO57_1007338 [Entomophthora muscae]|uniref:Uncharacterized protein n=1 Tax=Entomophthora muscae TaxID=34485 RepID=A0ACC2S9F2_9FUNG|nr:hypothetical protein DSO57_1007338 [Entomophthora muscae]
MEDIKKLVADLVAKQSAVAEENKTTTKGMIEVSNMLDDYANEIEELKCFCQQITSIASEGEGEAFQSARLQSIRKEVLAFKKLVNGRTSKKCTEALNPSTVKPIPEAFKVKFPDGKTPIPLLRRMENTALSAEQQLYKVELD